MFLGSVVRTIFVSADPLTGCRAGYGRAVIGGLGATAVMAVSWQIDRHGASRSICIATLRRVLRKVCRNARVESKIRAGVVDRLRNRAEPEQHLRGAAPSASSVSAHELAQQRCSTRDGDDEGGGEHGEVHPQRRGSA